MYFLYATTRSLHISNDRVVAYDMQQPGCCIQNFLCNNRVVAYYMQRHGCCIYATTGLLHIATTGYLHIVCNNPVVAYSLFMQQPGRSYMQQPGCCIRYATTRSLHTCMGGGAYNSNDELIKSLTYEYNSGFFVFYL